MEKIDASAETVKGACGLLVDMAPMDIYPDKSVYAKAGLMCANRLTQGLALEFVHCGGNLVRACGQFGDVVRPLCPFDPIEVFDKYKTSVLIDELQVRVKELEVKIRK